MKEIAIGIAALVTLGFGLAGLGTLRTPTPDEVPGTRPVYAKVVSVAPVAADTLGMTLPTPPKRDTAGDAVTVVLLAMYKHKCGPLSDRARRVSERLASERSFSKDEEINALVDVTYDLVKLGAKDWCHLTAKAVGK